MEDACIRLQAYNGQCKIQIAILDAETVYEALSGGFMGNGTNHNKMIISLCTRTKLQLVRTKHKFRELYDGDLRNTVRSETAGWFTDNYGRMMSYAMASAEDYIADMIDKACQGWGCDETLLIELFCTKSNAEMRAGKEAWEGRTDRSLTDYLTKELASGHATLLALLLKLLKGERDESGAADAEKVAEQAAALHQECAKVDGWFSSDF